MLELVKELDAQRHENPAKAQAAAEAALDYVTDEVALALLVGVIGSCLRQQGKLDEAEAEIADEAKAGKLLGSRLVRGDACQRQSVVYLYRGEFENALLQTSGAIIHFGIGHLLTRTGQALVDRGMCLLHLDRKEDAAEAFWNAKRYLCKDDVLHLVNADLELSRLLRADGKTDEAVKLAHQAISISPRSCLRFCLAHAVEIEVARGDLEAARRLSEQAVAACIGWPLDHAIATVRHLSILGHLGMLNDVRRLAFGISWDGAMAEAARTVEHACLRGPLDFEALEFAEIQLQQIAAPAN